MTKRWGSHGPGPSRTRSYIDLLRERDGGRERDVQLRISGPTCRRSGLGNSGQGLGTLLRDRIRSRDGRLLRRGDGPDRFVANVRRYVRRAAAGRGDLLGRVL